MLDEQIPTPQATELFPSEVIWAVLILCPRPWHPKQPCLQMNIDALSRNQIRVEVVNPGADRLFGGEFEQQFEGMHLDIETKL